MSRSAEKSAAKRGSTITSTQATRETVESVVIAVILAFLFRGFVAEAFVIPTGSMAPTLMGRHMDVTCPQCDYSYRTGATEENERYRGVVETTYCPMCRFPLELDRAHNPNQRSFTGDRILVSKFAYELADPKRWDVIVFKYPGNAKQNYIKRLVGLPGELIRIRHGDIYTAQLLLDFDKAELESVPDERIADVLGQHFRNAGMTLGEGSTVTRVSRSDFPETVDDQSAEAVWYLDDPVSNRRYLLRVPRYKDRAAVYSDLAIARKSPDKEKALLQGVFDTRFPGDKLVEIGWPTRWKDEGPAPAWRQESDGSFQLEAATRETAWLRYRHVYPSESEWEQIVAGDQMPEQITRPEGELIADYYTYNDRQTSSMHDGRNAGINWVGDLAIECELSIAGESGELILDLVEGGIHFRCAIDLSTGRATLSNTGDCPFVSDAPNVATTNGPPERIPAPTGDTVIKGPGKYRLRFSNIDDELRLWVNDTLVAFDQPTTYIPPTNVEPRSSADDPGDLAPAGIGARGTAVDVQWIALLRDVYYLAIKSTGMGDYQNSFSESVVQDIFRSPDSWQSTILFQSRRTVEFVVPKNAFFPLGDNSPQSMDGRLWGKETYFERDLLIGKAMMVYWPHAWRRPIPFLPNFRRMALIH